jgi:hypothetical protein
MFCYCRKCKKYTGTYPCAKCGGTNIDDNKYINKTPETLTESEKKLCILEEC